MFAVDGSAAELENFSPNRLERRKIELLLRVITQIFWAVSPDCRR